jgi:hypothetical protein
MGVRKYEFEPESFIPLVLLVFLIALILTCIAHLVACAGEVDRGAGGDASSGSSTAISSRRTSSSYGSTCHRVTYADTCHAEKPIAVEFVNDAAPGGCELHSLAPDYFCCPLMQ